MKARSFLPKKAAMMTSLVIERGAEKHGMDGWKTRLKNPDMIIAEIEAIERHLNAIRGNRLIDRDSMLPHAAHVAARALFLCEMALMEQVHA